MIAGLHPQVPQHFHDNSWARVSQMLQSLYLCEMTADARWAKEYWHCHRSEGPRCIGPEKGSNPYIILFYSTALMTERRWSIAHDFGPTSDIWHQPVNEAGDFVELLFLQMFIYFVKVKFAAVLWRFRRLVSKDRVRTHVPRCGFIDWLNGTGSYFSSSISFFQLSGLSGQSFIFIVKFKVALRRTNGRSLGTFH